MAPARVSTRHGLTRRDVVIAVVLLGLAVLLVFPFIVLRRDEARRNLCELRQQRLAKALLEYEETNGRFPGYRNLQAVDRQGRRRPASWVFATLPYLEFDEQGDIGPYAYVDQRYGPRGGDETRGEPPREYLPALVCPDSLPPDAMHKPGWLSYVASSGLPDAEPQGDFPADWPANGVFVDRFREPVRDAYPFQTTLAYIKEHDDAPYTLLLSENVDSGSWTDTDESRIGFLWLPRADGDAKQPAILRINALRGKGDGSLRFARPSSYHAGGVIVAYASGATAFLNESVDELVLIRAMTADDTGVAWPGSDKPIGPPYRRVQ